MKRVLLKIAYDGTLYHGWQVQPNAITVQQTLQDSLEKMLGYKINVTGCSRTDAGVHAKEFYCHLNCDDKLPKSAFLKGLNSILPNDISVLDCFNVPSDFHARYNAVAKNYIYRMYCGINDPFLSRYALRLEREPDIQKMNAFCQRVIGTHDFIAFSSSARTVEDTVRTVTECEVKIKDNVYLLSVTANGFLYNMVRILAGTALAVSYSRLEPFCADRAFQTGDRSLLGDTLSPCGLVLNKVFY